MNIFLSAVSTQFKACRDVLAQVTEPAMVVLGPPGCGKSTLLRRLDLDLAVDALHAPGDDTALGVFLSLNRYRPVRVGEPLPAPQEWLEQEWARRWPGLRPFGELLRSRRVVLLLDAVNEMPHGGEADYHERIALWRDFLTDLARSAPGTRVVFSCRSLDHSASLSTPELPVPHVRIEHLADEQVEEFLSVYSPDQGRALWQQLQGTAQLDLFRSPYYLKLLVATLLQGRAALFTGFVRQALAREVEVGNALFRPGALLGRLDHSPRMGETVRTARPEPAVPGARSTGIRPARTAGSDGARAGARELRRSARTAGRISSAGGPLLSDSSGDIPSPGVTIYREWRQQVQSLTLP